MNALASLAGVVPRVATGGAFTSSHTHRRNIHSSGTLTATVLTATLPTRIEGAIATLSIQK